MMLCALQASICMTCVLGLSFTICYFTGLFNHLSSRDQRDQMQARYHEHTLPCCTWAIDLVVSIIAHRDVIQNAKSHVRAVALLMRSTELVVGCRAELRQIAIPFSERRSVNTSTRAHALP
ncbi:hypothetical protein GGR57DRAFT_89697 [Xylariaceae sp. FL1272]|nr:hypothetical protein GGR57DRAFT_89697 [Xylariaceae sp. FL1272]